MISSVSNPKIKALVKLHQSKYRKEQGRFLVENEHLVLEAIASERLKELYVTKPNQLDFQPQQVISEAVAKRLSQTQSLPEMIGVVSKENGTKLLGNVLVLEDLQDPGNVGTLFRSALSFGYQTIVLTNHSVDYTNDKIIRASQGALFHLNILELSLEQFMALVKADNYTLLASVVDGGQSIRDLKVNKHALLLGNEGSGLKKATEAYCDLRVTIPTTAFESLNVAIAGSIMMYELSGSN